ncbi:hypothetical protein [Pseudovibrio sp. POLY-S9]|uniref:hypothetical protein n=1 Tax=Pseudovibrio sp. POLY-S9 TaxID=1576596 RepID=UPI000711259C|nr:hypothetical protein [Pseudovibrio sp. POLY-S9]
MKRFILAGAFTCLFVLPVAAQTAEERIKEIFLVDTMDNFCDIGINHQRTLDYIRNNKLKATPHYIVLVQESIQLAGEVQHTLEDAEEDANGVVCIQLSERAKELGLVAK